MKKRGESSDSQIFEECKADVKDFKVKKLFFALVGQKSPATLQPRRFGRWHARSHDMIF